MDISLNIKKKPFKLSTHINEIEMEGKMSQNYNLGPSFYFMKCRSLSSKK